MINWYKTPRFLQWMFPERVWTFPKENNAVLLTFDDGPIPNITPWVINELKKYDAKATFFCIGENIKKHPAIFKTIISEGHSIGNHTYNHLNGWKTNASEYVKNVLLSETETIHWSEKFKTKEAPLNITGQSTIASVEENRQLLFRPPYGKMTHQQSKILQNKGCKIIMWDILSGDYNASISEEKCLQNVIKSVAPGSIIVFHDSLKAEENLRYTLPKVLKFISEKGWHCEKIEISYTKD